MCVEKKCLKFIFGCYIIKFDRPTHPIWFPQTEDHLLLSSFPGGNSELKILFGSRFSYCSLHTQNWSANSTLFSNNLVSTIHHILIANTTVFNLTHILLLEEILANENAKYFQIGISSRYNGTNSHHDSNIWFIWQRLIDWGLSSSNL